MDSERTTRSRRRWDLWPAEAKFNRDSCRFRRQAIARRGIGNAQLFLIHVDAEVAEQRCREITLTGIGHSGLQRKEVQRKSYAYANVRFRLREDLRPYSVLGSMRGHDARWRSVGV